MKAKKYKWFLFVIVLAAVVAAFIVADFPIYKRYTYIDLKSGQKSVRKYILGMKILEDVSDTRFSQKVSGLGLIDENLHEHLWYLGHRYILYSNFAVTKIHEGYPYGSVIEQIFMKLELAELDLDRQRDVLSKTLTAMSNKDKALLMAISYTCCSVEYEKVEVENE